MGSIQHCCKASNNTENEITSPNPDLSPSQVEYLSLSMQETKSNTQINHQLSAFRETGIETERNLINSRAEQSKGIEELSSSSKDLNISIPLPEKKITTTFTLPYKVVSSEKQHKYSIGEIIQRSKVKNQDMTVLKKGVVYPMTQFVKLHDGSVYRGEFDQNFRPHGRGFLFRPDGSIFFGYFNEGKAEGQGKLLTKDRILIEGEFLTCEGGESTFNGEEIVPHGFAVESFPNKCVYQGNFFMGAKQGKGVLELDGCKYKGEFYNDVFEGKGKMEYVNGNVFVGHWKDGLKHGFGKMIKKGGKKYEGEYKHGERDGEGTMVWSERKIYKGQWKEGKQHGSGVYTFFDKIKGKLRSGNSEWNEGQKVRWLSPRDTP